MRDYTIFIPELIAGGAAILIVALELTFPRLRRDALAYLTAAASIAWIVASCFYIGKDVNSYQGVIQSDNFTTYFRILAGGVVAVTALLSAHYLQDRTKTHAEYYGLLLTAGIGTVYMAAATELITAYIALELLSFSLYILVGYLKRDALSAEASLKYILLGAFSSAMLLYGFSLIYGVTQSLSYAGIAEGLAERGGGTDPAVVVGFMLIITGVGFKVAAAPFHMWSPDAYEGSPLPITAFLSTLSKAAGFALFLRLFTTAIVVDAAEWRWAIALLSAVTMVLGNVLAIQQKSLKRLIAYSSIGQVGYMLVVIAAIGYGDAEVGRDASSALLLHMSGYIISTLALFTALIAYYNRTGKDTIEGLRGLAETSPFLALIITVSLFSFAGLPFFAGFATKLFMFQSSTTDGLLWLVSLAVINSFVSLYYYLMVLRQVYLFDPEGETKHIHVGPVLLGLGALLTAAVVAIGVYPGPFFEAVEHATEPLYSQGADSLVAR